MPTYFYTFCKCYFLLLFTSTCFIFFSNKNKGMSNTTKVVNVNESINCLESYESISDDVKYMSNSLIRLKILAVLYEKPQNMKELTDKTKLNYSSVSSILHGLELRDFVYRKSNRYHLTTCLKMQMENILKFKDVVNVVNGFFNIFNAHIVDMIPEMSLVELYMLKNAILLESSGFDAYKIFNFIGNALDDADCVKCIMPFYHEDFNVQLNNLVENDKFVEAIVSVDLFECYEEKSDIRYLSSFKGKNNFLLISTDKMMIFGLFRDDGFFDQNRLITSKDKNSIMWANNLFKNFKINEF